MEKSGNLGGNKSFLIHPYIFVNPRRACAARVTVLSVCLSVRPSVRLSLANLAVQGTGRPVTATNRFRVARSLILIECFS